MIVGAAFCPHPPVLVPQLAGGAAAELDELRLACRDAITRLARSADEWLVIGSAPGSADYLRGSRGTVAGYGRPVEVVLGGPPRLSWAAGPAADGRELPLSLTIGAYLLADALGSVDQVVAVAVSGDDDRTPWPAQVRADDSGRLGLLVMGDGSARRTTVSPGSVDPRAVRFDDAVETALRDGDSTGLSNLDRRMGEYVLAAGVSTWRAAGDLLRGREMEADLLYADAPYGVGYFVALWST